MTETAVVTGAAGFIGRWVVADLFERGVSVRGVDDLSAGSRENVAAFTEDDRFALREANVRDRDMIERLLEDAEVCIHLAAEIDVHESLEYPERHFETNVEGTYAVLEACRETDTRLCLVGTCMIYDLADQKGGIDESHPVVPASPYAGSKLAAENLALSYYHGYDLPITTLRPFNTYGPYQRTGAAGGVVPIFVERDVEGKPLKIYGDGTQTRDLLYVTDCARFVVDAAFSEEAIGETINAGTGVDVSVNDLAEVIATDGTAIEHVPHHHPQSEIDKLVCDPTKAKEMLGWEPEVSLEAGIERLRTWFETGGNSE